MPQSLGSLCRLSYDKSREKAAQIATPAPGVGHSPFLGNLFPLNKANAAHETQAFIIYGKFIIGPVYGCGGTECSSARAAVTDQPRMLHFHTIAVLLWAT